MSEFKKTDRGFKFLEVVDLNNETFRLSESSLATEPAIRLYSQGCGKGDCCPCIHLSLRQAHDLACKIHELCLIHYQVGGLDD